MIWYGMREIFTSNVLTERYRDFVVLYFGCGVRQNPAPSAISALFQPKIRQINESRKVRNANSVELTDSYFGAQEPIKFRHDDSVTHNMCWCTASFPGINGGDVQKILTMIFWSKWLCTCIWCTYPRLCLDKSIREYYPAFDLYEQIQVWNAVTVAPWMEFL